MYWQLSKCFTPQYFFKYPSYTDTVSDSGDTALNKISHAANILIGGLLFESHRYIVMGSHDNCKENKSRVKN